MLKFFTGGALCIVCCAWSARAGFERTALGARQAGMGLAAVAGRCDAWSATLNPAALGDGPPLAVAAYSAPAPFGRAELATAAAGVVLPGLGGGFGVAVRKFGFDLYREVSASAGFGAPVGPLRLGMTINLHHAAIASYGSAAALGVDAGMLFEPLPQIRWGIAATNINAPRIGREGEPLPRKFSTGVGYAPAEGTTLEVDAEKSPSFGAVVSAGAEVTWRGIAALRCGIAPDEMSAGIGVIVGLVTVDYAYVAHAELGGTHEASVTIRVR